ncbi:MAG: TRAP transporter small permease subunit [Cytophagales bacterium]|nr:TRAP transporter small permease subunit [Cytophagales bacterium]MDW8384863.1 TRAP transporter small permease subunit [Flammeovirgaceae bacterium]
MKQTLLVYAQKYICAVDTLCEKIGKTVAWFTTLLVLLIVWDVIARYWFSFTSAGIVELEWHLFAAIFLLSTAYTFQKDRHVRVDVWYSRQSLRTKAFINLIGGILFLLPLCIVCIVYGAIYAYQAWWFQEGSPDAGGLPYRFIIKSFTPIGIFLLFLQGISEILKALLIFAKK